MKNSRTNDENEELRNYNAEVLNEEMLRVVYRTVKIIPQYFLSGVLSGVRIIVGYILTEMYVWSPYY